MAKVKFGAGIADARGSVGSMTFSRNSSGAYLREKVSPVNPQTPRQALVRARLADFSREWATLTEAQRIGWSNLAQAYPRTDVFGNPVPLSGIALFQASNGIVAQLGGLGIQNPPPDLEVETVIFNGATFVASTRTLSMTFDETPLPGEGQIYVMATPAHSAGKSYIKNLLRFAAYTGQGVASPASVVLPASFGPYIAGQTLTAMLTVAAINTGAIASYQRFTIVAAP